MSTSYTSNLGLGKPASSDRNWHTPLNANFTLLDGLTPVAGLCVSLSETPSTTLNVNVSAGKYVGTDGAIATYAGVTNQAITASTTKYLYLTTVGTLTIGSAFPTSGWYVPLAVVVAGGTTITSITDARAVCRAVSAGATSGSATLVAGTVTVSTAAVAAGSKIVLARQATGGTLGHLSVGTITAGTSFVINSSSGTDTSVIYWEIR